MSPHETPAARSYPFSAAQPAAEPTAEPAKRSRPSATHGVLLSAHGTVEDVADIPAFLAIIRRGRPTPAEIVNEVTHRFQRIGGSPLLRITREQANGLSSVLGVPVLVGMRLWKPTLDAALDEAAELGLTDLVSLPLAPQSVQVYHAALHAAADARRALGKPAPRIVEAPPWGQTPAFLGCLAACVQDGLAKLPGALRPAATVILSAHSLPTRIIASGDPYETQFRALAEALIAHLCATGATQRFVIAFQSQGMDGGDWLGPDLATSFAEARREGAEAVVVAPIGFVSDHVETLYDLDIEASDLAARVGLTYARAPAPNARASFIEALAQVARPLLDGGERDPDVRGGDAATPT